MQHLIRLLDAMSRKEKHYFSTMFKEDRERSFYKIYRALLLTPTISTAALKERFPEIPQLPYELNNLYNRLLQSLVVQRLSSNRPDLKIANLITKSELLLEKQNLKDGGKMLKKARSQAEHYERYMHILQILGLEVQYLFSPSKMQFLEENQRFYKERKTCLDELDKIYALDQLINEMMDLQFKYGMPLAPEEVPEFIRQHPLLTQEIETTSHRVKIGGYFAKGIYGLGTGQYDRAIPALVSTITLMNEAPHLRNNKVELTAINNLIMSCILKGELEMAEEWMGRLQNFKCKNKHERFQATFYELTLRCERMIRYHLKDHFEALAENMIAFTVAERKHLSMGHTGLLYNKLIYAALLFQNYDRAHELYVDLFARQSSNRVSIETRQLSLCIHLGLGNYSVVESELRGFRRSCNEAGRNDPVTTQFASTVAAIYRYHDTEKLASAIEQAYAEFSKLAEAREHLKHFHDFNALHWLERCYGAS